ncbi:MAG: hypothetical protein J6W23_13350 [Victivallales bacterium]|nr:hypothetical protein [Victivallales bacterium]MBO7620643.1 hypothetical protein [Victivallales bacterium]
MKTNKMLRMFGCAAIALCVTGCDLSLQPTDKAQSKKGPAPKTQQTKTVQKVQPTKPMVQSKPQVQPQPQQQPQRRTITDDVNSVVNYGIGATQLKAKQNMQNKIQNIQQRKNKEMEDALK